MGKTAAVASLAALKRAYPNAAWDMPSADGYEFAEFQVPEQVGESRTFNNRWRFRQDSYKPFIWYLRQLRWPEQEVPKGAAHFNSNIHRVTFLELAMDFEMATGLQLPSQISTHESTMQQKSRLANGMLRRVPAMTNGAVCRQAKICNYLIRGYGGKQHVPGLTKRPLL